jgi:hypothetical protein
MMLACTPSTPTREPPRRTQSLEGDPTVADVDCSEVVYALTVRRGLEAWSEILAQAHELRTRSPHLDIPIDELVHFHAPVLDQGRSNVPAQSDALNVFTRHVLCDPLLNEVVTQQFLATHPEYRL